MNNTKRITAILLIIAFILTFVGCAMPGAEITPVTTLEPTPEPTPITSTPYKGDGSKYTYIMTDERDRAREEDIVYFADTLLDALHGHPLLTDRNTAVATYNVVNVRESNLESFYNEELRMEFIRRVNELILSIPERSDQEIIMGIAETMAILRDAHTCISLPREEVFLFWTIPIQTGNGIEAYITAVPKEYEQCLLSRLDAINGINIDEIVTRMSSVISYEAETCLIDEVFRISKIVNCDILRYIGIMGDESTAIFTMTDQSGETYDVEVESVQYENYSKNFEIVRHSSDTDAESSDIGIELLSSNTDVNYWYKLLSDNTVLYIRFNNCYADKQSINEFMKEATAAVNEAETVNKVIIDFRENNGGSSDYAAILIQALKNIEAENGKYVLIDGASFSAATALPALIKRFMDGVVIAGSPSAQPPNFFAGTTFELPNLGVACQHSTGYRNYWPDYNEEALMPDILVHQTFEDLVNGVDTVLKTVMEY